MQLVANFIGVGEQLDILRLQDLEPAALTDLADFGNAHTLLTELEYLPLCIADKVSCALAELLNLFVRTEQALLTNVQGNKNLWDQISPLLHFIFCDVAVLFQNGDGINEAVLFCEFVDRALEARRAITLAL